MFSASTKSGRNSGAAPDAQFNYVTMLLHGDGTNGAQNNTFLDSSTNNYTITRNGNTTQGSFSPYGSNWSNYFNGSSDYLSLGTSTNLALGAGDFTIEVFLSVTAYNASTSNIFEWRSAGGTPSNIPTLYLSASGVPIFYASVGSGALITGSSAVALNTWTHLAIVRSGSTVTMYLNGTSVGSATNSANLGTQSFYINDPQGTFRHNGYFSNVRMVKGTAVYTGSFTPSTTPLTAITNTQLLTCQSNRFIDNSSNAFAITATGTPSVQRFNPFGTSTAYSTSVIGGSGYFDGSGDYLTCSASVPATGAFTVEMFVYPTSTAGYQLLLSQYASGNAGSLQLLWDDTTDKFTVNLGLGTVLTSSTTYPLNAWHHLAITRDGSNNMTMWVNGASAATTTNSTSILQSTTFIATRSVALDGFFNGYLSNVRVTNTAVYTTAFTPPTAPLTAISGTSLLLNYTNGAIFDNAMMNDLETVGDAQISTSVVKFGTGSMKFDGTGDWLRLLTTPNITLGSGNFTFEGWLYLNTVSGTQIIFDQRPASSQGVYPVLYMDGATMTWYINGAARITSSSLSASTWYNFAISRSSGSTKLFINGTQSGSTYTDANDYLASRSYIGISAYDETGGLNGYIDDLRITKGYARYTANFTAPTAAFSDTGPY